MFVVLHLVPFHLPLALAMSAADGGRISQAIIRFPGIFASPWHMHIMFLISGAATYYALRFRSVWGYVLNRLKRLLVPLLFC
ncbi:acyltransferase family protein, partial [Candidatus Poribacteria bacterium]|nr:acyltransferase family protein [Candidatus Poribacteria bacterium]